jgi:hypothetical protein
MFPTRAAAIWLTLTVTVYGVAEAGRTRSFRIEGPDAFRKGRMNGVTIDDDGRVGPGPAAHVLAPNAGAQVWSLIRDRQGDLLAATGSDGSVYRIEGKNVKRIEGSFEYEVFTVVEGKGGRTFVAGAPNATISEILPDGTVRTFFDTPEKVVWCLVTDPGGSLYAGTGERGAIYHISPDGTAKLLYTAEDMHVTALSWSKDGKLIAGTSGRGLLLEVDPASGAARVLFEAPVPEIPRVAVAPSGEIYFAAAGVPEAPPKKKEAPPSDAAEEEPPVEGSRIFVRKVDGTVRELWQSPDETVHALVLDPDGNLLVGTGSQAGLYRLTPAGKETLLWRPEEGQILAILAQESTIFVGTGNPGRVYALGPEREGEAWVRPEPLDATSVASWGHAIWETLPGSGRWEIVTRSGHTQDPDSSWSGWSAPMKDPEGTAVASPPARFLQCEARFIAAGDGPPSMLRRIWLPYNAPNQPPRIGQIRLSGVAPSGARDPKDVGGYTQDLGGGLRVQFQRSQDASASADDAEGPPAWVRDVRSLSWDATDPDGDNLRAGLGIRRVGEASFRTLTRNLASSAYAVDTSTLPDGQYEVRLNVTDAPSNAPGEALTDEKIGGPFRVDHRAPAFVGLTARKNDAHTLLTEGKVDDDGSPIVRLEVSWDGKPWRPASSVDGFLDSRTESFRIEIPLDDDDEGRWVAVRASDAAGNEAVDRVWLAP